MPSGLITSGKASSSSISDTISEPGFNKVRNPDEIKKVNFNRMKKIILVLAILWCLEVNAAPQRPNIIILLTDDHRWDAVGFNGNNIIQTPNLDRLAHHGIVFNNACVVSSICCSSRASILSGQYLAKHGISTFDIDFTPGQLRNTYPLILREAGYQIGFIGKYGVGLQHPDSLYDFWECPPTYQPDYESSDKNGNPIHHTDLVAIQIHDAISQFSASEKPFCLSVSFKAPHCQDGDPRQFIYHPRYESLYENVTFPRGETAKPMYWDYFPEYFKENNEGRARWSLRFDTEEKFQHMVKSYYRLITHVDDVVGAMVQQLNELGFDENTVILFMGDNGFFLGEHGLAGKWFPYEESIRIPMMIYDPRVRGGKSMDELVLNIDVAPTILRYAGLPVPPVMQGEPLQDLLMPGKKEWRSCFYYEFRFPPFPQQCEALVTERYKYIVYPESHPLFEEIYDLKKDPLETHNIIGNKRGVTLKNKLKEKFYVAKEQAQ